MSSSRAFSVALVLDLSVDIASTDASTSSTSTRGVAACATEYTPGCIADLNPSSRGRYRLLFSLLRCYGLLRGSPPQPLLLKPIPASAQDLEQFHLRHYIQHLLRDPRQQKQQCKSGHESLEDKFGLEECREFKDLSLYVRTVAGATLACVKALLDGSVSIAINWFGGRHHALPARASGFCYVNDAVLGILRLCQEPRHSRIAYIDLDVHHGDGVAAAFARSRSVLTVSIHHRAPGFFPCSGACSDVGAAPARYYTLNVPLRSNASDRCFERVFVVMWACLVAAFDPTAVVLQLGVDGLRNDPLGAFQLSVDVLSRCLARVRAHCLQRHVPLLLLGGGGYRPAEAAKAWTILTATACGLRLPNEIPFHEFLPSYGPDYTLRPPLPEPLQSDQNSDAYIEALLRRIRAHFQLVQKAERASRAPADDVPSCSA